MRILLLDLGRTLRGGQVQVYYLARALHGTDGYEVLLAGVRGSPLLSMAAEEGIPTLGLAGARGSDPRSILALRRADRRTPLSLLHTHDARGASLGAWCRWSWAKRISLVHTRRVSYPLGRGLSRAKYRAADAVVAVSGEIAGVLAAGGVPADRISTIHSGIDPRRYRRREERGDGRFVFGLVGALTGQKGYEVLLEAMFHLVEIGRRVALPPWEVRVVGEGPLRSRLVRQAERFGLASRLSWLGAVDSREILPGCDAILVPSVEGEGSSGVIKEGWVTGLPVITSALPSNLELVRHGENGLVVPVGDAHVLASAMGRLLGDAGLRRRLAEGGLASVASFTDQVMVQAYRELYQRLAAERANAGLARGAGAPPQ